MNVTIATPFPAGRSIATLAFRSVCALLPFALSPKLFAPSEPSLVTGQKKSFAYSWEQERQIGADTDKEVVEQMGLYDNQALQAYVQAVGERVLGHSEFASPSAPQIYRDTKFTFRVIDSPVVNAFAVPGGYVYVTRGLLSHLQNEAQLAVVLGHEIAHVAARHSSQQARRAQWGQLGAIVGSVLGQKVLGERAPDLAPAILQASGMALETFMLRYSREAEIESDQLGVRYATHAGYAAAESAHFFHTLSDIAESEGKALPTWRSTHPDPGNRAQNVVQFAVAASPDGTATNVGDGEYLRHIEGLVVGDDPRGGFVENGVFYHPELRFQLPLAQGWKLDNQRAAVVLTEPNGRAMMGLRLASATRAREAATQFAQQNKVQVTASGDTTVNGLPASVIVGKASTDKGNVGVWNAFLEKDGRVYSLLGYAPEAAFEQMRPTFETVAAGFSPLRLPADFTVQPARLKVVRADRNAPFASFVPTSLTPELSAEAVAHMNQTKLNEPVTQGRALKIPEAPARPAMASVVAQAAPDPYRTPASQYPSTTAPQGSTTYPSQYPAQTYPQPGYPPSTTYPPQSPQTYPPQSYPPSQPQTGYPPSTGYPNYPQPGGYPQQTYPPQNYPQSGYPSGPQTYPPQPGYPQQQPYPQQYPPPSQPQWPQSGTQQQQPPQPRQPQGTVWPR